MICNGLQLDSPTGQRPWKRRAESGRTRLRIPRLHCLNFWRRSGGSFVTALTYLWTIFPKVTIRDCAKRCSLCMRSRTKPAPVLEWPSIQQTGKDAYTAHEDESY